MAKWTVKKMAAPKNRRPCSAVNMPNAYTYVNVNTSNMPNAGLGWVGVRKMFESVCLFVCPEHNSKTKDPKVFKLGTCRPNDIGISYKWYGFRVERSKIKVRIRLNSNTAWVLTP